jgi:cyclomaltodextrin glucanotransferase
VRRYRDSLCFVALNRGGEVTLPEVEVELPDGEYTCVVTRNQYEVKNGKIDNLQLAERGIIVFSHVGERINGETIVRVQLNGVNTQPGETIVVTGDCPELGNWDITKAYPLEYINANTWFAEIPFDESTGNLISYKYAMWREGRAPVRENLVNRRWVIAKEGTVKWRDTWAAGK